MTIREAVYSVLAADVLSDDPLSLKTEGLTADDIWNIEGVDNPDRGKPFLVTAWASTPTPAANSSWSTGRRRDLLVWAHDEGADYARIDRLLDRVKELLMALVHQGGISQVVFTGGSGDLYDDGFRTITRNYGFRVIGTD